MCDDIHEIVKNLYSQENKQDKDKGKTITWEIKRDP